MNIKTFLTAAALLSASSFVSAQIPTDTVITVISPSSVIITKSTDKTLVEIQGSQNDSLLNYVYIASTNTDIEDTTPSIDLPFISHRKNQSKHVTRGYIGFKGLFCGTVMPTNASESLKNSWEIGINEVLGYRISRQNSELRFSIGCRYSSMNIAKGYIAGKEGDQLTIAPAPDNAHDIASRIDSWHIYFPITYSQRIYRTFGFSIAVAADLNVNTRANMSYKIDDTKYSKTFKGLHQRILTPDFIFTVGSVDNAGVYVRWSPVKSFKGIYGPSYSSVAVGISLVF